MILTGTVIPDNKQYDYLSAEGATYEEARAKLDTLLADGQKLLVIRRDQT
ncbi:hypothetical protein [Arthrobacter sp. H-02-3]|nr:hypothetical protein [Arthrobacter sp. H-02-3]